MRNIVSPILYIGNKRKLINKGLIELFPSNVNNFYDIFGGSGAISLNTKAKNYYLNDISFVYEFYQLFKDKTAEEIINQINANISKYKLPLEQTNRTTFKNTDKIKEYKTAYNNLRKEYNKNKKVMDLYTLMFFSFSQHVRFNKSGEFNMPFGNNYFSENHRSNIKSGCDFFQNKNVFVSNKDFKDILNTKFNQEDFVYLDPPYLITSNIYNKEWTEKEEKSLLNKLKKLNNKKIKFGLSNVLIHNDKENTLLIEWCKKNKFKAYTLKHKFNYNLFGNKASSSVEVYICNYEIKNIPTEWKEYIF